MGKKRFIGLIVFAALLFTAMAIKAQEVTYFQPFNVYSDKNARTNHYIASGWMNIKRKSILLQNIAVKKCQIY